MKQDPGKDLETRMAKSVRLRAERRQRWLRDGEPSLARNLGQIGALGWTIIVPILLALAAGRWLDHHFDTGIFWTAPLIMLGAVFGCWAAWRWISTR
jgi:ATP synthase protein I